MGVCEVCGNDYDKTMYGRAHVGPATLAHGSISVLLLTVLLRQRRSKRLRAAP